MREKFDKIVNSRFGRWADKYINTPWYSAAIAAVCILCHSLNIPVVGACLLTVLLVPALLFCNNSYVLVPFLLMCSFVVSEETMPQTGHYNNVPSILFLCIALACMVLALAFNIVYYGKWKRMFKRAYLTVPISLCSGVLIVGGLFSPTYTTSCLIMALPIALTMYFPYSMMINCGEYKKEKTVTYFAYAMVAVVAVIAAAILHRYAINDFDLTDPKSYCYFGYAGPNTSVAFVVIAIPMTFYLVCKYKHGYLFLLLVALEVLCTIATGSRAAQLVAIPGTLIVMIALCFKIKKGRIGYWIITGIALVGVIAVAILLRGKIVEVFTNMANGNFGDSGRFSLWRQGFAAWKDNPIFGAGLTFLYSTDHWYYSFHCTPLTYLYCAGIIGFAAYVYHRYKTVRLVFSAKLTVGRVFVALSVLAMLCNALLDIAMTSPQHLLYYSIMLAIIEADVLNEKNEKSGSVETVKTSVAIDSESSV